MFKLSICLLNFMLLLNCFNGRPTVPDEAKIAHKELQKLRASTQTGVTISNYEQLVIEAKTAVNLAETKLPITPPNVDLTRNDVPEGLLMLTNSQMHKAMDAYQDAAVAWRCKISGKKLIDTNEGKEIQRKHNIPAVNMDADTVLQYLWDEANMSTLSLQGLLSQE